MHTIGILYPGDMGHSVARVLLEDGFVVVTTLLLPGVMQALEWLVPTYPAHAARRADEIGELAETLAHFGFSSVMARGTQQTLAAVGRLRLAERFPERGEHGWTIREVLEVLTHEEVLKKTRIKLNSM